MGALVLVFPWMSCFTLGHSRDLLISVTFHTITDTSYTRAILVVRPLALVAVSIGKFANDRFPGRVDSIIQFLPTIQFHTFVPAFLDPFDFQNRFNDSLERETLRH